MKTISFNSISKESALKADPVITHNYYPIEGDDEVYIECKYFTNTDTSKYLKVDLEGAEWNLRKVINDKVVAIHGIEVEFKDGTAPLTKEMLCTLPFDSFLTGLAQKIFYHLLDTSRLTEEEEKN